MTTLPSEIIDKIFSYIQGNNNQLIKKEFAKINSFGKDHITFTFNLIRNNLIRNKILSNHKVIEYNKYFKYSMLHNNRKLLLHQIGFGLKRVINQFNYSNHYNYTKILKEVREIYIHDYYYEYDLTYRQERKYHNSYFKYTILHENHKNVCNHIKRYNTKKQYIVDKKLFKYILLERGIIINFIKKIIK
jgi:hypothetical protein